MANRYAGFNNTRERASEAIARLGLLWVKANLPLRPARMTTAQLKQIIALAGLQLGGSRLARDATRLKRPAAFARVA